MTRTATNHRAPLDDWYAQVLRLTVFLAPGETADPCDWWRNVTNAEPENTESKPRIGTRRDSGNFNEGLLIMEFQPSRSDWLYCERPDAEGLLAQGNLVPRIETFSDAMRRWLPVCPRIARLAFGAILTLPCDSKADTYRTLSNYLNFDVDFEHSSDFLYQINRQRQSVVIPSLLIHRLIKWGAVQLVQHVLTLGLSEAVASRNPVFASHRCMLELDMNTANESLEAIDAESLPRLLGELVDLGQEIVREGDVP
jgi:hypothetical protein